MQARASRTVCWSVSDVVCCCFYISLARFCSPLEKRGRTICAYASLPPFFSTGFVDIGASRVQERDYRHCWFGENEEMGYVSRILILFMDFLEYTLLADPITD